ncbi:hypothetical protein HMI56_001696 [Coelomomyces lativittatus]|nr:hypothetical protein HMI56_001696 [Coelomomyces lativittatus]
MNPNTFSCNFFPDYHGKDASKRKDENNVPQPIDPIAFTPESLLSPVPNVSDLRGVIVTCEGLNTIYP